MSDEQKESTKWTVGKIIVAIPITLLAPVLAVCLFVLALTSAVVVIFALPLIIIIAVVDGIVKG